MPQNIVLGSQKISFTRFPNIGQYQRPNQDNYCPGQGKFSRGRSASTTEGETRRRPWHRGSLMEQSRWYYHCAIDECSTHLTCSEHSGAEIFLNSSTMAHAGEAHLFLEKIFSLQSPSWPWRNPNWKTQAWIKCAEDTSNSSNWNHFKVLKFKNPLSFSNSVQYLPLTEFTSETISTRCIPTFFSLAPLFWASTKLP